MRREAIPTWEELEEHSKSVPEINPAAVIAMLGIKQAAEEIQESIMDILKNQYQLSEGRFCALIVLHQNANGIAPSVLAEKIGVTRATVSTLVQRLERDGFLTVVSDESDGRGKKLRLTKAGRDFMASILPPHYLRISKLMGRLSRDEQKELIRLLSKLSEPEIEQKIV